MDPSFFVVHDTPMRAFLLDVVKQTALSCAALFKVMLPVIVLVKLCDEAGATQLLALPLSPVMELVGLPAEAGLAWAAGCLNFMYTGLAVYATMADSLALNVGQVTILGTMLLMAHGLLLEAKIAEKCGAGFAFQIVFRLFSAVVTGLILRIVFESGGFLQDPAESLWIPEASPGLAPWLWSQVQFFASIAVIIFVFTVLWHVLERLRIAQFLEGLVAPLLRIVGIGREAATLTVVGMTLGLAYGGGLLLSKIRQDELDREDVFYSLSLMGICHSLIEDTLLVMLIGAHISGALWARLLLSLLLVFLLRVLITHAATRLPRNFIPIALQKKEP
jgi:hypothetical protein